MSINRFKSLSYSFDSFSYRKHKHGPQTMAKHLKVSQIRRRGISEPQDDINYDPIGSHIIALRKYNLYLDQQLREKQAAAERSKKGEKKDEKKGEKRIERKRSKLVEILKFFPPPAFPQNYPFSQSFEKKPPNTTRVMVKYSGGIPKKQVEEKRKTFVKSLVEQAGFSDIQDENMILNYLSGIVDDYLQKFAIILSRNKNSGPFSEDKDLWNALETTLRNFGIDGISALHVFYYENVVKKHDILQRKCEELYDKLQES